MQEEIIKFIRRYIPLSETEADIVRGSTNIQSFEKNHVLLSEGEYAKNYFLILKGCVRVYYLIDGAEKTTEFYVEYETIVPASVVTTEPSEYFIACVEECTLAIGTEERDRQLIEKVPRLKNMIMKSDTELRVRNQIKFDNFKNKSPEMRYKFLLDTRPDLINRVSLQQLASYLGITPVSLSRMRKRISQRR